MKNRDFKEPCSLMITNTKFKHALFVNVSELFNNT